MTKEQELVSVDICGRLPYKVKVGFTELGTPLTVEDYNPTTGQLFAYTYNDMSKTSYGFDISDFRPYLRPMSSMTDDEIQEYVTIWDKREPYNVVPAVDWLNKHMFDYRGLIEKGLAIAVTDKNNPYKY